MSNSQTRQRHDAVRVIHDIVTALRAIAAGRIQGAQRALAAAHRYEEVVLRALGGLLTQYPDLAWPDGAGQTLLIVFTSEQPLCGTFNQEVVAFAEEHWRALAAAGPTELVVVGQRGVRQFAAHGITVAHAETAATGLAGLPELVKRLAPRIDHGYATRQLREVRVIYNRYRSVSEKIPTEAVILPPDPAVLKSESRCRRHHYLSNPELLAGLIGEYAFIRLFRIAADSFASEQASRLTAMDAASRNTEQMLDDLAALERRERQDLVTRQVLELLSTRFTVD